MKNAVSSVKSGSILMCGQWQFHLCIVGNVTNINAHFAKHVDVTFQNKH